MNFLPDIPALQTAIVSFTLANSASIPANVQPLFATAASKTSPVDMIVAVAECLYANQADFTNPAAQAATQTLAGQCAAFAVQNGWHDMPARGPGILAAMRRDLGETAPQGLAWPQASADPAPKPEWIAAQAA